MTQKTTKHGFEIVGGPSKGEIAFALMFKANGNNIYVTFHTDQHLFNVFLTSLKLDYSDNEKENWFFEGTYRGNARPVHGFFSTKVRKGWMEMEVDE